jgi:hypothetical protein
MSRRRRILDSAAVGIVVLALAVLFWPFDGSPDDDAADGLTEIAETTPTLVHETPDSPAPDIAVTPSVEPSLTPTSRPASAPSPTPHEPHPCDSVDLARIVIAFVDRFNEADLDGLRELLPAKSYAYAPSLSGILIRPEQFHAFIDHRDWMGDIDEIIHFLRTQHERGERWRLEDVETHGSRANQFWRDSGLADVSATLIRSRAGFDLDELFGGATVNCADETIVVWRFLHEEALETEPIPIDEFLEGMKPLEPGQMRTTLMDVSTTVRIDGGALNRWRVQHDQALDSDGTQLQRVFIRGGADRDESMLVIGRDGWYLNHRGWEAAGGGSPPALPLEYELVLHQPDLTADLIRQHEVEIPDEGRHLLTRNIDEIPGFLPYSRHFLQGEIEFGEFITNVEDRSLSHVVFRVFDRSCQPFVSPELRFIGVRSLNAFDPTGFEVTPAGTISERQFHTSDPIAEDLNDAGQSEDGFGEVYEFERFGLEFRVEVSPSRGGLYPSARGDDWEPEWFVHAMRMDVEWIRWTDAHGAGHPTHAIWDTGRYRFSLAVQSDPLPSDVVWGQDRLLHVVRALSRT